MLEMQGMIKDKDIIIEGLRKDIEGMEKE